MKFTTIDLQTWPRAQMFYYFSQMAPTGYSMTVNIDVTTLHKAVKTAQLKFFPSYLWLITKNLNNQIEFKTAKKDEVLGYYDTLTPLYASFHEDDKTFSLMWTDYSDDFHTFYENYIDNQKQYSANHGVLTQSLTPPPENAYTVSCIPWVTFNHFAVHTYENKPYYFPSVEAGKLFQQEGKLLMPLSLTCHHATTDGYHISQFLQQLNDDIIHFEQYL